jgi:hypothetical protein
MNYAAITAVTQLLKYCFESFFLNNASNAGSFRMKKFPLHLWKVSHFRTQRFLDTRWVITHLVLKIEWIAASPGKNETVKTSFKQYHMYFAVLSVAFFDQNAQLFSLWNGVYVS